MKDAATIHGHMVETLQELTALTERGVLGAGEALAEIVTEGRRLEASCAGSVATVRQEHGPALERDLDEADARIRGYVQSIGETLGEEEALVVRARTQLVAMRDAARRLEGIAQASGMLSVAAQVETAHLAMRGSEAKFEATVTEMRKLADLVDRLQRDLGARVGAMHGVLDEIEEGSVVLRRHLQGAGADQVERIQRLRTDASALIGALGQVQGLAGQASEALTVASQDALSELQFQDPMIQELQRLDALVGGFIEEAQSDAPLAFQVNLGDRTDLDDSELHDDDEALDSGELLLF